MKLKPIIDGIISFIPGARDCKKYGTGGTCSARYCYSVWLRHLVMAEINGLNTSPRVVAELGPGDSLGVGLSALLSGSNKYFAFDIVQYASNEKNLQIFEELISLLKNKTPIPSQTEFPELRPSLPNYEFPAHILTPKRLQTSLHPNRISQIRYSILNPYSSESLIQYKVPWNSEVIIEKESVDMILSQAVLEHVDNLEETYKAMYQWLAPDGYISHQIDFKSHHLTEEWNEHWTYPEFLWKIIRGKRLYLINREPLSTHINILKQIGFKIVCNKTVQTPSNITRQKLASKFKYLTDEDLITSGTFIQAKK